MEKVGLTLILLMLFLGTKAQDKSPNIVFDVTSSDVSVHKSALRHAKAMSTAYPESQFEVVIYSGALDMVLKNKSSVETEIEEVAKNDNVSFVVCKGTMKRFDVDQTQIINGVGFVSNGILEVASKQAEGWAYVKEAK